MTNEEKFEDEILDIAKNWHKVAVYHGEPCACESISCPMCDFHRGIEDCNTALQEWLKAEYEKYNEVESVERMACEMKQDWSKNVWSDG